MCWVFVATWAIFFLLQPFRPEAPESVAWGYSCQSSFLLQRENPLLCLFQLLEVPAVIVSWTPPCITRRLASVTKLPPLPLNLPAA